MTKKKKTFIIIQTIPFNFQGNIKKNYLLKSARNEKYVFISST